MTEKNEMTDIEEKVQKVREWVCSSQGKKEINDSMKYIESVLKKLEEERRIRPESLKIPFGL